MKVMLISIFTVVTRYGYVRRLNDIGVYMYENG